MSILSRRAGAVAALVLLTLTLQACGKKPSHLDPPDGVVNDTFPRTYPAPRPGDGDKTDGKAGKTETKTDSWGFP